MTVRVGWRIPQFPADESKGEEFVSQIVRSLEEAQGAFDSAWMEDHMVPGAAWAKADGVALEGWTTVTYLMGVFKRLSFGHIVLCNSYRNPALLAKMGATLACLAPARFILGLGAGWKENEYKSYGYKFPSAADRIESLGEAIQIIRKMWTEETTNFKGKYYEIIDAYCNPKPNPIPPIMVGGAGAKLLRLVATRADWWNMLGTPDEYEHRLNILRTHCRDIGRELTSIKKTWLGNISISESHEEAALITDRSPFPAGETTITGNPVDVARELRKYADLGVEYFILRFLDFPDTKGAKLFAEKVAPQLR